MENKDELLDDMEIAAYDADGEYVETADFECDPLALAVKTGNRRIHFWANREAAYNDPIKVRALAYAYFRWEPENITEDIILILKDVALNQYSDEKLLYIYDKAVDGDPVALAVCQRVLNHEWWPWSMSGSDVWPTEFKAAARDPRRELLNLRISRAGLQWTPSGHHLVTYPDQYFEFTSFPPAQETHHCGP